MSTDAYRGSSTFGAPILTIDNDGYVYEGTIGGEYVIKAATPSALRSPSSKAEVA